MAKNQINFSKMTQEIKTQLRDFSVSMYALAKEDVAYKKAMKPLKAKLENILENRNNDIDAGLPVEEVVAKFPRAEVDREIKKLEEAHKKIIEPVNNTLRNTYSLIPEGMYAGYKKKIEEHKRGEFLTAITEFLQNLGLEGCKQGQISKFAETMSDMFGARIASSKKIVDSGEFCSTMSKAQFNKLFMSVFCDLFVTVDMLKEEKEDEEVED